MKRKISREQYIKVGEAIELLWDAWEDLKAAEKNYEEVVEKNLGRKVSAKDRLPDS